MAIRTIKQLPVLRNIIVRPRLAISAMVACAIFLFMTDDWRITTKLLSAWDSGVTLYLALTAFMMAGADDALIRKHADAQDEGSFIILGFTIISVIASLGAIVAELVLGKDLSGAAKAQAIGLAAVTVFLSWLFMQTMFALHYAHEYYKAKSDSNDGGLEFPAKYKKPDYWDFVYFSYVIGTAAATADINLTSRLFRRLVTLHCVLVFFFNTTILALAINVGASLV